MLDFDICNAARLRRDPDYDGVFFGRLTAEDAST